MYILVKPLISEDVIKKSSSKSPKECCEFFNILVYNEKKSTKKKVVTIGISELNDLTSFLLDKMFPTYTWKKAVKKCKRIFSKTGELLVPYWVGYDWI